MNEVSDMLEALIEQEEAYLGNLRADAQAFPQLKKVELANTNRGFYSGRDMDLLFVVPFERLPIVPNHIVMECLP